MEEQIREHERAIIKLKRARNSLLNVSKLPPEVLGNIFQQNVTLEGDFGLLNEGSRNFLFVCHHWFEVALGTPEVWSYWGDSPTDWACWHHYSGSAPLDLVLFVVDYGGETLNTALCDALRDRAARDAIRRVHLWSEDTALLSSVISPLATVGKGIRSNSVESFILSNGSDTSVDISDFFAHYRFPRLQRLELCDCIITSWDLLTSRTTALTSLTLHFSRPSSAPTASQLFSILASNPSLRKVSLSKHAIPAGGGGETPSRVSLHHLKELELDGGSRHIVGLLRRLDHPRNVDLDITLCDHMVADIPRIFGPYLRDYLRRRDRSPTGLGLSISRVGCLSKLHICDAGGIDLSTPVWTQIAPFVVIANRSQDAWSRPMAKVFLNLVSYTPRDEVVYFRSWNEPAVMEDTSARFPKLKALHSGFMPLPAIFPGSNLDRNEGIPTSLKHIRLEQPVLEGCDWGPLTNYLACRSSSGNRLDSLTLDRSPRMCLEVEEHIRSMVREFRIT